MSGGLHSTKQHHKEWASNLNLMMKGTPKNSGVARNFRGWVDISSHGNHVEVWIVGKLRPDGRFSEVTKIGKFKEHGNKDV